MAGWIVVIEWVARLILLVLIGLSVWSLSIILNRRRSFREFGGELTLSQGSHSTRASLASVIRSQGKSGELVAQALEQPNAAAFAHALAAQVIWLRGDMERGLPVLGTLGATAPFIGLLGTVFGIIVAFGQLSTGQVDSMRVMFILAEALILTAVGLAVAIPAVMANNFFSRRILSHMRALEAAKELGLGLYAREESANGVSKLR